MKYRQLYKYQMMLPINYYQLNSGVPLSIGVGEHMIPNWGNVHYPLGNVDDPDSSILTTLRDSNMPIWNTIKAGDKRSEDDLRKFAQMYLMERVLPKLQGKGKEYNDGVEPALANFYKGSDITYQNPGTYLFSQCTKQYVTVAKWLAGKAYSGENITDRITDIIVYMVLLMFMLDGQWSGNKPTKAEEKESGG